MPASTEVGHEVSIGGVDHADSDTVVSILDQSGRELRMEMIVVAQLSLHDAWTALAEDPNSVLIDVRTLAEWNFVGVPALDGLDKEVRFVEWISYPGGQPNPEFMSQAAAGLDPDHHVLLICRSGARSDAAARLFEASGFSTISNVTAGFEGDLDAEGHRVGGWKHEGLPWRQQ